MSESISRQDSNPETLKQFKRLYKACLSCRTRKVKCDLGEVSNPHDPPCLRCKRERKECVFAQSRRGGPKSVLIGKRKKLLNSLNAQNLDPNHSLKDEISDNHGNGSSSSSSGSGGTGAGPLSTNNMILGDINHSKHPTMFAQQQQQQQQQQTPLPPPPSSSYNYYQFTQPTNPISKNDTMNINLPPLVPSAYRIQQTSSYRSQPQSQPPPLPLDNGNHQQQRQHEPLNTPNHPVIPTSINKIPPPSNAKSNGAASTIIYLANIAGDIAKADERDRVDARLRYKEIGESTSNSNNNTRSGSTSSTSLDTTNATNVASKELDSKEDLRTPVTLTPEEYINNKYGNDHTNDSTNSRSASMDKSNGGTGNNSNNNSNGNDKSANFQSTYKDNRYSVMPITNPLAVHPKPSKKLIDIEYIGDEASDILDEEQARRLVILFFTSMHPYFPYVPPDLHDADTLAQYPVLLCAILTISARYHQFEEVDELKYHQKRHHHNHHLSDQSPMDAQEDRQPAHIEVHERLWVYCQRLISQTVWGEASTRSIGTVLAFLLFTEWNPRAIHWRWADYANTPEDEHKTNSLSEKPSNLVGGNEDSFAGLSALKRSEMMSFMLIGTASRLSFVLEDNPYVFLATHIAETFICVNLNRRSMLSQSLNEVDLDHDDDDIVGAIGDNDDDNNINSSGKEKKKSTYSSSNNRNELKFDVYQRATLELLQLFQLCYECLYYQKPKLGAQNLAVLDIMTPILEKWYRRYHKLLIPSGNQFFNNSKHNSYLLKPNSKYVIDLSMKLKRESLILDYYYIKLYIYSLALNDETKKPSNNNSNNPNSSNNNGNNGNTMRLDKLTKYSKYVEMAYKAAKEVLSVIQRVNKLKLLKYMPVRWTTRVIKAVAFVVKCYLTLTENRDEYNSRNGDLLGGVSLNMSTNNNPEYRNSIYINNDSNENSAILSLSVISTEELIDIIQKTALALRDATPDELHLCTRYSTILMYLCSQFKSKSYQNKTSFNFDYEAKVQQEEENAKMRENEMVKRQRLNESVQRSSYYQPLPQQQDYQPVNASSSETPTPTPPPHLPPVQHTQQEPEITYQQQQQQQQQTFEIPQISNANQEMFDEFFTDPSEFVFNWFSNNNNQGAGLDFVDQWTKEIELDFLQKGNNFK